MLLRAHVRSRRYSPALVAKVRARLLTAAGSMQPQVRRGGGGGALGQSSSSGSSVAVGQHSSIS